MTDAFIKAAEEKGHTVTRFDAALKKVGGKDISGKECALIACCEEDDMMQIYPAVKECDVIAYAIAKTSYSGEMVRNNQKVIPCP